MVAEGDPEEMWRRQKTGSFICRSCGLLVGVNDEECYHCGVHNPTLWGLAPMLRNLGADLGFINLVTAVCALLYFLSLALGGIQMGGILSMASPGGDAVVRLGASGAVPVFVLHRWWTLLSAGWLHGGLLHIALNLYWLHQLGPLTAEIYGPGRMILIYLLSSVAGFFASSLAGFVLPAIPVLGGARFTLGASAAIFGLFGALVYSGRRGGSSALSRQMQSLALILFVFGIFFPGVDNWAHAGGFAGGYLASRWLDPMLPERTNHLFAAAIGIVLSILSVLVSFLDWPP